MKGVVYIDGVNIWDQYGVWITRGGYDELLTFPALKEPASNDWPDEDGIEVDLSNPVLADKEVSITFLASKREIDAVDFIEFISSAGYRTLRVESLGREWSLRLLSQPENRIYRAATPFTLRFAQDIPVRGIDIGYDPGVPVVRSSYEIDGISLDKYGIIVDSARDEVLKSPTAKIGMSRDIQTVDGVIYDAGQIVFNAKEVPFKCRLKASSMEHFWQCYDAFFADLIKSGERTLYVDYTGEEYPCHYRRSSGFDILTLSGQVMVQFTFTLVFTVFRVSGTEYLLASEDDYLITTEDDEFFIDLGYAD